MSEIVVDEATGKSRIVESAVERHRNSGNDECNSYTPKSKVPAVGVTLTGIGLILLAIVALIPWGIKLRSEHYTVGKEYQAVGVTVFTTPVNAKEAISPIRTLIRTPDNQVFNLYWRTGHEAPPSGSAVGVIKYHDCGRQSREVVECFDSFNFLGYSLAPLDQSGKNIR